MRRACCLLLAGAAVGLPLFVPQVQAASDEWPVVAGGSESIRYSPLKQIDRSNVSGLKVAWRFDAGDAGEGTKIQCNPVVKDGVVYATTARLHAIALDAATGKLLWRWDPAAAGIPNANKGRNRGLTLWGEGEESRVFGSAGSYLYALDSKTGRLIESFGTGGMLDLRHGLGRDPSAVTVSLTTPGIVFKDMIITGMTTSEDLPSAPGDVRAFDTRTGKLRWQFHTIPAPDEPGAGSWPEGARTNLGGANNWAGMALDASRGIVFVPTGSGAFDFYGANRKGDNLYANCLLALDASSGKRVWHYQFVRHDVWDRDLPSPPSLVTLTRNGKSIDAVAQITKSGHVWVFERETGKPLFDVEEKEYPASDVEGEMLAPLQRLPASPPAFSRQQLTEADLSDRTPAVKEAVLERFRAVRSGGQFTPPSKQGTIVFPGFDGGGEWGGPAFDPASKLLYVNANEMAWILRLVPRPAAGTRTTTEKLYQSQCGSCHGRDRSGSPPAFPSLIDLGSKRGPDEVSGIIRKGAGRMPAFPRLTDEAVNALTGYLLKGEEKELAAPEVRGGPSLPYKTDGYNRFLDADGYPAIKPPWGTLNAIDLEKGEIRWSIPLGEYPKLAAQGIKNTGSENYGGSVVTAGGLLFIGATNFDRTFRAFDKETGQLLWSTLLPAAGNATPAVYMAGGRQYVLIAAGGDIEHKGKTGSSYVAFALDSAEVSGGASRQAAR